MVTTSMSNSGNPPEEPNNEKALSGQGGRPRGSLPVPKSKRGVKGFFKEVGRELKKVSWPTKAETNRLTGVVLAVCVLVVIILSTLGAVFGAVIDLITKGRV